MCWTDFSEAFQFDRDNEVATTQVAIDMQKLIKSIYGRKLGIGSPEVKPPPAVRKSWSAYGKMVVTRGDVIGAVERLTIVCEENQALMNKDVADEL